MDSFPNFKDIQSALDRGDPHKALQMVAQCKATQGEQAALSYLEGKAYMKLSDWREAQNAFLKAEELQPGGPSKQCLEMLADIMAFFNKDMYNQ